MTEIKIFCYSLKKVVQHLYYKFTGNRDINPIVHSVWPHSSWREVLSILPLPVYLFELNRTLKIIGENIKHQNNLGDYIQLSRFIDQDNLDRLSCDWCSIVNGSLEFILDSIKGNSATDIIKLKSSLVSTHSRIMGLTRFSGCIPGNTYKVSDAEIDSFIRTNNIIHQYDQLATLKEIIGKLLELRNVVEIIESRWCPFRYLSDIAYERHYWGTDVDKIAELLRDSGRITCTQCVPLVNRYFSATKIKSSVFEPYVQNLIKLSRPKV